MDATDPSDSPAANAAVLALLLAAGSLGLPALGGYLRAVRAMERCVFAFISNTIHSLLSVYSASQLTIDRRQIPLSGPCLAVSPFACPTVQGVRFLGSRRLFEAAERALGRRGRRKEEGGGRSDWRSAAAGEWGKRIDRVS